MNNVIVIPKPTVPPWRRQLVVNTSGKAEKLLVNAIVPLRHAPEWSGVFRYNLFSHKIELPKPPPWEKPEQWEPRQWQDQDISRLTEWLQRNKILVGSNIAADAAYAAAYDSCYHPVKDYLTMLEWDKKPRLSTWLTVYLGAVASEYHTAIGIRWPVSGVARIMAPGKDCQADCVLILEGEQGLRKSTALRTLGGAWFLDDLRRFSTRDAAMQLAGRWIVELAELAAMNETTIEACKSFLSTNVDTMRLPYGRNVIEVPRQCIFSATTNKDMFLKDETGDRRYWPVTCTRIDIEALKKDRDQLWAEAVYLYNQGQLWWMDTPELQLMAQEAQNDRFDADPWEFEVRKWLLSQKKVTPEKALLELFGMEIEDVTKGHRNRISAVFRHLGWSRVRLTTAENRGDYVWISSQAVENKQ